MNLVDSVRLFLSNLESVYQVVKRFEPVHSMRWKEKEWDGYKPLVFLCETLDSDVLRDVVGPELNKYLKLVFIYPATKSLGLEGRRKNDVHVGITVEQLRAIHEVLSEEDLQRLCSPQLREVLLEGYAELLKEI